MFNLPQGGEIIVILLLALVILGPEKLPDMIRRVGKTYAELKKLGQGFQDEFKSVIEEPAREMRETADLLRKSIDTSVDSAMNTDTQPSATPNDTSPELRLRAADDPPHGEPTTDLPTFRDTGVTPAGEEHSVDHAEDQADPEARSA